MFNKILIANRGENDREAGVSAKPNCIMCEAHASEFTASESENV